jgi:capsule polysaccharide modification protein KpsS
MILKKIFIGLIFVYFLSGCAQNAALLGPAITVASTGNIYQAGLSYGTSEAVYKITGKTSTENVKNFFNKDTKDDSVYFNSFLKSVKKNINTSSGIKDFINQ